ncbi:hypothetical protein SAMN06265370_11971 [Puniceibacterium sediminis]|uniref:Uncharacterized protein n=1 Tax=Puniceibacterium sediminis TaxID=1608407 RepID=A0A238YTI4_9RHOB|nr:hypothetical protein SAMN06265370_11971 [Puniceibacterium sediminis]
MIWQKCVQERARQSGFVVSALLPRKSGRLIEYGWTCETFADGRPIAAQDLPSLRAAICRFHDMTEALPQRPGFLSLEELLTGICGGDVDPCRMPEALIKACRSARRSGGAEGCCSWGSLTLTTS